MAHVDGHSAAPSESGSTGVFHNKSSMSTTPGDESIYGDGGVSSTGADLGMLGDDAHALRQLVQTQQQRIEFLENMHQQALRQLRKTREELRAAQQQTFREADKVLGLEQLISEMQVQRFEGDTR